MRQAVIFSLMILLLSPLTACSQQSTGTTSQNAPAWQEQYDLGVKYLSEGNYQEAIIAFTAAIEIDPKRPEAYIGLADVYTAQGDTDKAVETLSRALEAVGEDEEILGILEQLERQDSGASGAGVRTERIDLEDGRYYIYAYDANGFRVREIRYNADGTVEYFWKYEYDADGFLVRETSCNAAGTAEHFAELEYDADGNRVRQTDYSADGTLEGWHLFENDSNGNLLRVSNYSADGTLQYMEEADPDRHQIVRVTWYNEEGTVRNVEEYTG